MAQNPQTQEELKVVPVFESAEAELAFWAEHDPWESPDYWEECEIWIKHKSLGWIRSSEQLLDPNK